MNPLQSTPKEAFNADEVKARQHRRIVQSPIVEVSLDAALLEYMRILQLADARVVEPGHSFQRLIGAKEFMDVWKNLSSIPLTPSPQVDYNLVHA